MKYIFFFLLLLSDSLVAQVNLNKGLVAYYPFNNNANDESGNNNNPTTIKVSFTTDRFGKTNSACSFNGKNNYIRIPDDASLHFRKGFSISAWVMVNGFYEGTCHGNRIIMKGYTDYLQGNFLLTFDDNYSSKGGNCFTNKPDKKRQSFYAASATPFTDDYIIPGKWYLLTYTYDGNIASLYVDCKLQAKGVIKNYDFSNNDDLIFGKMDNAQYPYWFNGLLDEVRFYNRPLNKDEIRTLCDDKQIENNPETICTGANVVPAKFDYIIADCTTASFNLSTTKTTNLKSIQWFFGDGTTSDKLSPAHVYKKYGTYKVKAIVTSKFNCADTFTREIQFQELRTDFVYSEQGSPGELLFKAKNNKASYSWSFGDDQISRNESAITHQYKASGRYTAKLFARNSIGCRDTVQKNINITLPEPITTITPVKNIPVIPQQSEKIQLEQRTKDVITTIPVENDSISISLYDNGIIDGDSITLIYNNNIILTHQLLKDKPVTLRLKIDPERRSNELVMYAENLGSIPPNTALMIIMDGENRYQVNVSSTKTSNGIISFTLKNKNLTASQ